MDLYTLSIFLDFVLAAPWVIGAIWFMYRGIEDIEMKRQNRIEKLNRRIARYEYKKH